jgi:hypothetical protein
MSKKVKKFKYVCVYLSISSLLLSSCANLPSGSGGKSSSENGGCNPQAAAFAGAVFGAILGQRSKSGNAGAGAAIGAVVAGLACVAWNYKVDQTKTAAQVNASYRQANNGTLPVAPKVTAYSVSSYPSATLYSGQPLTIASTIEVVQGSNNVTPLVEQEMFVYHDGKVVGSAKKVANLGNGAGEFQTQFTLQLPKGVPQGVYPVKTSLYLNGVKVEDKSLNVQVVSIPTFQILASL